MTHSVRKQSEEAAALNEHCALIKALLGGTKAMRAAGKTHLPQWPNEDDDSYNARLGVATLFPAYQRTIEILAAKPFSKSLTLSDEVPKRIQKLTDDVDNMGRNLHSFLSEVGQRALGFGFSSILVDYPPTLDEEGKPLYVTKADELAAGVRPYFVEILADNILGWLPTNPTSAADLTQLRLLEIVSVPDGEFAEKKIEQVRVLGKGTWAIWRKSTAVGAGKDDWVQIAAGKTSTKNIPFVPVYGNRLGFMQARPALLELAYMNVEHWQSKSDQQTITHIARVPILFAKMLGDNAITVGAASAVKGEQPESDLKFVEHGGAAIEAGRLSILDLEDRMRQAGAELLVNKPGNKTEIATESDNEQGSCALAKVAENIEDAADQALQFMAEYIGEADGGSITLFKDFGAKSLAEASAELLLKMGVAGKLSDETLHAEMQRRGIIGPDVTWDDEKSRMSTQGVPLGAM